MLTLVMLLWLVRPDRVQLSDLLHYLVIKVHDIRRLDICRPILLQLGQILADLRQTVQNGLLARVERREELGSVRHSIEVLRRAVRCKQYGIREVAGKFG